ncbi:MAG: alpha/beta fold hydrolase [Candidatus Methanoperedens sp.]|nr:alpha/beta fold hydrolase [Candidatus Methanoperedens sp.]MCZ7395383.1 alpha/beta fold hydrolase [Candidatus Methanoperedens sp.]
MDKPHKTIELILPSQAGELEALLTLPVPEPAHYPAVAVICHPHPLYGGSMHSKVVVTASHAFLDLDIPSLRFNFRGVGKSSGKYDNGRGETDDVRAAIDHAAGKGDKIIIAGHSFGAWVGMKAGCGDARVKVMIGIGTPAGFGDMDFLMQCGKPRLFIHGTLDTLIPIGKMEKLCQEIPEPKKLIQIGADHFFTGKLDELADVVRKLTEEYLTLQD